jgi:hypothetical protein
MPSKELLQQQTEAHNALASAQNAELLAVTRMRNLDREFREWTLRREAASRAANEAMQRRATAQEKLRRFEVTQ